MKIDKVLYILAIFCVVAAFAVSVTSKLIFGTSLSVNIPLLIILILAVGNIWSDGLRNKKQIPQ